MTDRARHVYALLRTLLAWTPAPRARTSSSPGFISSERRCLNCKAVGKWDKDRRRRVDPACPHCGGTGLRPIKDVMDDPVELSDDQAKDARRKSGFGGRSGDDLREARYRVDDEIRRLEQQLSSSEMDAPVDHVTRSVELRDRMYRHGSYAELEAALAELRRRNDGAYRVAMMVAYAPLCEEPIEPVRRVVVACCEVLAHWMPAEIRVPPGVHVWSADELAERAREGKAAMQWGHSDWASASRAERKRAILLLAENGLSDGKIAGRFGVSREWVQRTRKGLQDVLDGDENGHEEAA